MADSQNTNRVLAATKGRGACSNPQNRFDSMKREAVESEPYDGIADEDEQLPKTTVQLQSARRIISINQSPDLPFAASINPYQGCEHGCIYCYARPSHAYLGLSPGLDFETRLFAKENAAAVLEAELLAKNYVPQTIVIGGNTDPYQPIERKLNITRSLLEVLERYNHPVSVTTKSALVTRDIDILQRMASRGLARVYVSVTSLRNEVSRTLEPRASAPARRLAAIKQMANAGIPVGVLVAPVIPAITDEELEAILSAASDAGASAAAYILLRLPHEVAPLFSEWLTAHYPLRKAKVENLLSQMRGGKLYDPAFGTRMTGTGVFAELLASRFSLTCRKLALNLERPPLRTDLFVPAALERQLSLF